MPDVRDVLSTSTVTLARCQISDIDEILDAVLCSLPELKPWCPWCDDDYGAGHAREFVNRQIENWDEGREYVFIIRDPTGTFLGTCGLNELHPDRRACNLGYWLRSDQTGNGYATAAVSLLVEFALHDLHMMRIEIVVALENHWSHAVARRVGAQREGVLRNRLPSGDTWLDAILYSVVPPRA